MRKRQFTKSLSVALPEEHFELIKEITDVMQVSMAEWVRTIVEIALETCTREEGQNHVEQ
jgi:hypothetical protein